MVSTVQLKSLPADPVVFDELDEAEPAAKALARERLPEVRGGTGPGGGGVGGGFPGQADSRLPHQPAVLLPRGPGILVFQRRRSGRRAFLRCKRRAELPLRVRPEPS